MLTYCNHLNLVCYDYTRLHSLILSNKYNFNLIRKHLGTEEGHEEIDTPIETGYTPLMLTVMNNKPLEYIRLLMFNGADINTRDYEGNTAIMLAIIFNNKPEKKLTEIIVQLLRFGADTNIKNNKNQNIIDLCYNKYHDLMKLILAHQKYLLFTPK